MSAMYVGHNPGEPPSGRGATLASLILCVLPLSVLWCLGAYLALNFLPHAPASLAGGAGVLARIRFAAGPVLFLCCTGIGLAALWSVFRFAPIIVALHISAIIGGPSMRHPGVN